MIQMPSIYHDGSEFTAVVGDENIPLQNRKRGAEDSFDLYNTMDAYSYSCKRQSVHSLSERTELPVASSNIAGVEKEIACTNTSMSSIVDYHWLLNGINEFADSSTQSTCARGIRQLIVSYSHSNMASNASVKEVVNDENLPEFISGRTVSKLADLLDKSTTLHTRVDAILSLVEISKIYPSIGVTSAPALLKILSCYPHCDMCLFENSIACLGNMCLSNCQIRDTIISKGALHVIHGLLIKVHERCLQSQQGLSVIKNYNDGLKSSTWLQMSILKWNFTCLDIYQSQIVGDLLKTLATLLLQNYILCCEDTVANIQQSIIFLLEHSQSSAGTELGQEFLQLLSQGLQTLLSNTNNTHNRFDFQQHLQLFKNLYRKASSFDKGYIYEKTNLLTLLLNAAHSNTNKHYLLDVIYIFATVLNDEHFDRRFYKHSHGEVFFQYLLHLGTDINYSDVNERLTVVCSILERTKGSRWHIEYFVKKGGLEYFCQGLEILNSRDNFLNSNSGVVTKFLRGISIVLETGGEYSKIYEDLIPKRRLLERLYELAQAKDEPIQELAHHILTKYFSDRYSHNFQAQMVMQT